MAKTSADYIMLAEQEAQLVGASKIADAGIHASLAVAYSNLALVTAQQESAAALRAEQETAAIRVGPRPSSLKVRQV